MVIRHERMAALVTGGTDGIGKEIARRLARSGVQVGVIGRDACKGEEAVHELRSSSGNPGIDFLQADLSLMSECDRVSAEILEHWPSLHYLVHSAGVVRGRRELTAEGLESNFATNYLSRYGLTQRLRPLLSATGTPEDPARVVIVSGAARGGRIYFNDVNLASNFSVLRAILQFCEANDLYTAELTRRLRAESAAPRVVVTCLKVGVVKTRIRRGFPLWMKLLVPLLMDPLLGQQPQEVAEAAMALLVGAPAEDVAGMLFSKVRHLRRLTPSQTERTEGQCRQLWDLSEQLAFPASTTFRHGTACS